MHQEILEAKGRLSEYRRSLFDLDVEAKGLITHIRRVLSPYEEDVTVLRDRDAVKSTERLSGIIERMRDLKVKIAKIEADLGREA